MYVQETAAGTGSMDGDGPGGLAAPGSPHSWQLSVGSGGSDLGAWKPGRTMVLKGKASGLRPPRVRVPALPLTILC